MGLNYAIGTYPHVLLNYLSISRYAKGCKTFPMKSLLMLL